MSKRHRQWTLAILLGLVVRTAAARDNREWSHERGGPDGSCWIDDQPVIARPDVLWRADLPHIVSGPVVSSGFACVALEDAKNTVIVALRLDDGQVLDRVKFPRAGVPHLAAGPGLLVVGNDESLRSFKLNSSRLSYQNSVKVSCSKALFLNGRWAVASDGVGTVSLIDVNQHKVRTQCPGPRGEPVIVATGADRWMLAGTSGLSLMTLEISGLESRDPQMKASGARDLSGMGERGFDAYGTLVIQESPEHYAWLLLPAEESGEGFLLRDAAANTYMRPKWQGRPAVRGNLLIGFGADGKLIAGGPPFAESKVLVSDELPRGALRSPPSGAGDVVYVGNWAIELSSGRVLWCLEDLVPTAPLVPAGPRRFLARTAAQLISYGERPITAADTTSASSAAPSLTGRVPGVVLVTGEFRPGPADTIAPDRFALIDDGKTPRLVGSQAAVDRACLTALRAQHRQGLLKHFARCLEFGLVSEAKRLLETVNALGLADAEREALTRKLASRDEPNDTSARLKREARREEERAHYAAMANEAVRLARWAHAAHASVAAAALLHESTAISSINDEGLALLRDLVPPEFPFKDRTDAAQQWARWAAEILPAGGRFLAPEDPLRRRLTAPLWNSDVIALATPSLLLFSRDPDPQVIGSCLRHGESAVELLTQILPPRKQASELLEIRLHRTRDDYLADGPKGAAKDWSAGHYSTSERLSRFYVPRADEKVQGRDLHTVLAHELTHHYLAQRWAASVPRQEAPGYWVVEGAAEFVAEQAVEMGRIGAGLEDITVRSLDLTSAAGSKGWLLPWSALVDGTARDFGAKLTGDEVGQLSLRHQAGAIFLLTQRDLFYAQAASLFFFLMHRRGDDGRARVIDYLDRYYAGKGANSGWQALGFASREAFESAMEAFVRELSNAGR